MTRANHVLILVIVLIVLQLVWLSLKASTSDSIVSNTKTWTLTGDGKLTELVMVPCHSIYLGGLSSGRYQQDPSFMMHNQNSNSQPEEWALKTYQKSLYQHDMFADHIRSGYEYTMKSPATRLLVFSGGQTSREVGPVSEAQSYLAYLKSHLIPSRSPEPDSSSAATEWGQLNVVTEDFARDSYENLLFSVCRFVEVTGSLPERISVHGFSFKQRRYVNLHRHALDDFPRDRFSYLNGTELRISADMMETLKKSEYENAYSLFERDLHGCSGKLLEKKVSRDPFHRRSGIKGYPHVCPQLKHIFDKCDDK